MPWVALYLAIVASPLVILLVGERPPAGGLARDLAVALGYSGLAMAGVQFALTARFRRATAPFGIDILYVFHRELALVAFLLLLAHTVLLLVCCPEAAGGFDPRGMPAFLVQGWLALAVFTALVVTSLWRRFLGIEYDRWRRAHAVLAVAGVVLALMHADGSGAYLVQPWKRAAWGLLAAAWLALAAWVRLVRPALLRRRPWRVAGLRRERGRCWTLSLEPEDGAGFDYRPGQFAWLTLRASPFALREHPFSFSSSPTRPGRVEFTIKELGDFTSRIGEIRPGETAYVDGPYGSFGVEDLAGVRGHVFVAGGVGIAPIVSVLRALADRGERTPLWLFYGNRDWERVALREEIDELATRLDLRVVHVLGEPPEGWTGERGWIDRGVLERHLGTDRDGLHFHICGPGPMIRLVERSLGELGVPVSHVHSEIFDLA